MYESHVTCLCHLDIVPTARFRTRRSRSPPAVSTSPPPGTTRSSGSATRPARPAGARLVPYRRAVGGVRSEIFGSEKIGALLE